MRLVDDDGVVGFQQRVGLRFSQQNAVRHQLDRGVAAQPVLKPNLETHHFAQRRFQLLGNPLGDGAGGNPARLGVADEFASLSSRFISACPASIGNGSLPATHGQGDFGQLRRLARAGFATDDDDLMRLQRRHDLVTFAGYGEVFGEIDDEIGGINWILGHGHRLRLSGMGTLICLYKAIKSSLNAG